MTLGAGRPPGLIAILLILVLASLAGLGLLGCAAQAAGPAAPEAAQAPAPPLPPGEPFPPLSFPTPPMAEEFAYLGIGQDSPDFTIEQVKAQVLIIEVFNMYCPHCQREAPTVNRLYELVAQRGLDQRVKFLGLGVGNSEYEVGFFQSKFQVPFPMLPDREREFYEALGANGTPTFVIARLSPQGAVIVHRRFGRMKSPEEFLKTVLQKTELEP